MTFQQQFEKLSIEYAKATLHFFEMDKELSENEKSLDLSKTEKFEKAKIKMQKASDKYFNFLALLNQGKNNPNDEYHRH